MTLGIPVTDRRRFSSNGEIPIPSKPPTSFIYLISLLSAISGFLLGYDTGIVSGSMVFVRDAFELNDFWHEAIVSITILFAAIFSLTAGYMTDAWGRKWIIIFTCLIFTPGAILCGLAWTKEVLLIGRLILGIGIGISSMVTPIYVAEVAPVEIRGRLVVIQQVLIFLGQFIAALLAAVFSYDEEQGWRWMLGIAAVPAIIQLIGFFFMPESPRWLIKKGRDEAAKTILKSIRGIQKAADMEFDLIKQDCNERDNLEVKQNVIAEVFRTPNLRRALLVGTVLWATHELSGINTIMYYCATIIQMSGVYDKSEVVWLAVAPAAISAVASLAAIYLVERLGRRWLVLSSLSGVLLSLIVIAVGFQFQDRQSRLVMSGYNTNENDFCSGISSCHDCIQSCGFCFDYKSEVNGTYNGTCMLPLEANPDKSVYGNCQAGSKGVYVWATTYCPTTIEWTVPIGLMLYLFFFAFGMAPMPWTINAEIYPLWARSFCNSFAITVNWIVNFAVSVSFLSLSTAITRYGSFYLYGGFALSGLIFFFFFLPETKGVPLEELEDLFVSKTNKFRRKSVYSITHQVPSRRVSTVT